ncbi:MAG: hypothetical protein HZB55_07210 [Deltaproteobacteria bacterium]|nr:hypothetical protein [Deltaproteobacteria bacterium]
MYLLELVRHIHLNPLRARVVRSLEVLTSYAYAGHATLLGKADRAWQTTVEVRNRCGDTVGQARSGYEEFVQVGAEQGRRQELVGGGLHRSSGAWLDLPTRKGQREAMVHDERVLGDSASVADLLADADWERRQLLKARTRAGIAELGEHVARLGEISVEELLGGGRRRRVVQARTALAQVAVGEFGHTGAALARYLGVAPSTVNRKAVDGELSSLAKRVLEAVQS